MKKIIMVTIGVFALAGLAYAGTQFFGDSLSRYNKSWSWRYKMIVEIETPEGIKTGSAVREVNSKRKALDWSQINNKPNYAYDHNVTGEAVVVDLGERGVLFALIDGDDYMDALNAFGKRNVSDFDYIEDLPSGSVSEFDPFKYPGGPKIVTFTDMNDPKSVQLVLNWAYKRGEGYALKPDNIADIFGEGVKLKSIKVEMTDEPVTTGVVDRYLDKDFWNEFNLWWKTVDIREKSNKAPLFSFKQGMKK